MRKINRWISALLALVIVIGLIPAVAPQADALYENYLNRYQVDGSYYTSSAKMAAKLNAIFDGYANVYHDGGCTNQVNVRIGTSNVKNNGVTMYAGPYGGPWRSAGTSCWIYAAGVYYTLFGEVGFQEPGANSEALNVNSTSNKAVSYENFVAWGVRDGVGAHIRTTSHSMIVLDYDQDTLTVLDGNNDGDGTVSVRKWSWDRVNKTVAYITQPTDAYYYSEYPVSTCAHIYTAAVTTQAGCTQDGVITNTCTVCGDSYTESIPAKGHDFQNDVCVVCGAADSSVLRGTCGAHLEWTLRSGTLTITGSGRMYDYAYGGAPWFKNRTSIKTLVVSDGVANIGDHAFSFSEKLTSVTIGNTVTAIGDFAFQTCTAMGALTIGSAVQTIGLEAFKYTAIKTLNIPDSTTYIGDLAFGFCEALTQVRLGKNVKTIRDAAFYNTPRLTKITFCGSAPAIGEEAFLNARAVAYYPTNDSTWNSTTKQNYGGALTWQSFYQGLNQVNGVWGYYDQGVLQTGFTNLVKHTSGSWYYVKNGYVNWGYTGLVQYNGGSWYYVKSGKVDFTFTGLVQYNGGKWYYVKGGKIDFTFTGLAKHASGKWYYVKGGQIDFTFTGLVKHTSGQWYYVRGGQVDFTHTGLVKHTSGKWYYVKGGKVDFVHTGLVKHTSGAWYYVQSGTITWTYTGLVRYSSGVLYYVEGSKLNWNFNGSATYEGRTYRVVNGIGK